MVSCSYFHIFVLNTIAFSALFKLRLCKNLYSKTFTNSETCLRSSSNQFVVAQYYFEFLVAEFVFAFQSIYNFGYRIYNCALSFWLRNSRLRFKLNKFWLRNLRLRFNLKKLWLRNLRLSFKVKKFWLRNLRLRFTMCFSNAQLCLFGGPLEGGTPKVCQNIFP